MKKLLLSYLLMVIFPLNCLSQTKGNTDIIINNDYKDSYTKSITNIISPLRHHTSEACITIDSTTLGYFYLNDPQNFTQYGITCPVSCITSAEYFNDMYYMVGDSTLFSLNPSTYEITIISNSIKTSKIAYNPVDGKLYGISEQMFPKLYSIDIQTGTQTHIVTFNNAGKFRSFEILNNGRFIACDELTDQISELNVSNGQVTYLFFSGFGTEANQDMSVDRENDVLYLVSYISENEKSNLYRIDLDNSKLNLIGSFSDVATGFAIKTVYNPLLPSAPTDLTLNNNGSDMNVNISWTNPSVNYNDDPLQELTEIVIFRNGEIIKNIQNPIVGDSMSWIDSTISDPNIYTYTLETVNSEGIGGNISESISVGESCNLFFELFSDDGMGWYDTYISVYASGVLIGEITLDYGTNEIIELECPKTELDFVWNSSMWSYYHYFKIYNTYMIPIFHAPDTLESGVFFTWFNSCDSASFIDISGTVTSSLTGSPIQEAKIHFKGAYDTTYYTDSQGNYSGILVDNYYYDIIVSADGYNTLIDSNANITGSQTMNFELNNPVLTIDQHSLDIETQYQNNKTITVNLTNDGDGPLSINGKTNYLNLKGREAWDEIATFELNGGGEQGIASDGTHIYTCSWDGNQNYDFGKYTMDGKFLEGFNIPGADGIRDLTYDGQYFYGTDVSNELYKMDFQNYTLVDIIYTEVVYMRHCAYYAREDCFYVGADNTLYKIDREGKILHKCPSPVYGYGSGIDSVSYGGPYLYILTQQYGCLLVQYDIINDVFTDFSMNLYQNDFDMAGGAFTGIYKGEFCFFANIQQDLAPNRVRIYELEVAGWLHAEPNNAIIYPGETLPVEYTFNGFWDYEGSYEANYVYSTSEPNIGKDSINVKFEISPSNCSAPQNLEAQTVSFTNIKLTWNTPQDVTDDISRLITYSIFKSKYIETPLAENISDLSYTFENLEPNTYCYVVKANYPDGCISFPSNKACSDAVEPFGNISGTVTDKNGKPLSDVMVKFDQYQQTKTDGNGNYSINVISDSYDVHFFLGNYITHIAENYYVDTIDQTLNVSLECYDKCFPVKNLKAVNNGSNIITLSWELPQTKKRDDNTILLEEHFENSNIPFGWIIIDDDGDGYTWDTKTWYYHLYGYNNTRCISSASYINGVGMLTPNNYLITPNVCKASKVSYVIAAHNLAFGEEHYAVMASSTGTDINDFTIVFEETLPGRKSKEHNCNINNKFYTVWFERQIELPEGTKYVAFRHYNCSDMFWLHLDNVIVSTNSSLTPIGGDIKGFKVYLNNEEIATINDPTATSFIDDFSFPSKDSEVTYCVKTIYTECESDFSCANVYILDAINDFSEIYVYPNPAKDYISVTGTEIEKITIYNSIGQLIKETNKTNIDVSIFADGIYMFIIETLTGEKYKHKVYIKK